mmetsp:Transcript_7493/g.12720  ORF Transcript_7493/g.12720 Transcript_7493/m.12720 type:complete len:806 (+) Transcript_7493:15-2432(+)|eukprot:CAMPEP_0119343212 /NCGR_PEP_ID=MMETSP1333-20130426/106328_1 /TAXON_ID=418940 /ORGANISM="Scyphosphaera apsteinii, Strain RCC1455" /LENGTH=805 /DNA_ID=CAMNT_0007355593 /DNA_START=14 /DNA_END=2431 /DNA_ORIENTATION=+
MKLITVVIVCVVLGLLACLRSGFSLITLRAEARKVDSSFGSNGFAQHGTSSFSKHSLEFLSGGAAHGDLLIQAIRPAYPAEAIIRTPVMQATDSQQSLLSTTAQPAHASSSVNMTAVERQPRFALRALRVAGQSDEARETILRARQQRQPRVGSELHGNAGSPTALRESATVRRLLQLDGIAQWRPSYTPSMSVGIDMPLDQILVRVPKGEMAWLAFGSAGVQEMLFNWAHHVLALGFGDSMLIAAFDTTILKALIEKQLPAYNYSGALPEVHFRHAPYLFHRMGFLKAELISQVINTGRQVLVSDSDVVWRLDPTPHILKIQDAGASIAVSTDCLDVAADRDKRPRSRNPQGCGHNPGNQFGAIFNTGVIWFAADRDASAFARKWGRATLNLNDPWSDDQGVFNRLIEEDLYPVTSASHNGTVIFGPRQLRIAPLAADTFCSGHLVWVQQGGDLGSCVSVHTTFTEYGDAGKRWRLLEAGLWGLLPSSYFEHGYFLTFVPPQPPPDPAPCNADTHALADALGASRLKRGAKSFGGASGVCGEDTSHGLPAKRMGNIGATEGMKRSMRLRANVNLMGRQVHALRDAMAIARVLNRTLILPHFDCLCDRSELTEVIPSCIYPGAPQTMPMPFKCSTHFVIDTHKLQMLLDPPAFGMHPSKLGGLVTPPLHLRAHSFLKDARTHSDIKKDVVRVHVHPGGVRHTAPTSSAVVAKGQLEDSSTTKAELPMGATNEQVLKQLSPLSTSRVLLLSNAEGAYSGWVSHAEEGKLFRTLIEYYILGGSWCCTSRNKDEGRVYSANPLPLRMP